MVLFLLKDLIVITEIYLKKKIVFEQGDAKWIDVLTTITEQYNNRIP